MKEPKNLIVLRYQRVTYNGVGGVEAHGKRLGGNLGNVDPTRTHLNEFPIGHADLREIVDAHIAQMQLDNAARKRASLKRRRRKTDVVDLDTSLEEAGENPHALAEVVGWPWDPKNVHPFTEGILSASHEWFLNKDSEIDQARINTFRDFSLGYLAHEFGGEVLYARLDLDEKTPHLSFLIAPEHENRRTKRRELSHRQHHVFGLEEVEILFDEEKPDPSRVRRSYEILQDRVADYAKEQGLDLQRGEHWARKERHQRELGEAVIKRKNVSPSRGREIAAAIVAEAEEAAAETISAASAKHEEAETHLADGSHARAEAEADRAAAKAERKALAADRRVLEEREESVMIGTQAIIMEELTYSPPRKDRAEGLTWGRNKPQSQERRTWLVEKIKPARDWLVGFARSLFGYQQERDAALADQHARAQAIVDAETRQGRKPPQTMVDLVAQASLPPGNELPIPNAWALPDDMTGEQIDKHLAGMTNTAICDAYAPTRDARDLTEHSEMQARYGASLDHLLKEAERRGLDVALRQHRPEQATDRERAQLHCDAPPQTIRDVRKIKNRERRIGD